MFSWVLSPKLVFGYFNFSRFRSILVLDYGELFHIYILANILYVDRLVWLLGQYRGSFLRRCCS